MQSPKMQKLNRTWRQHKPVPTCSGEKSMTDNDIQLKALPGRRRLGRFAVAVSTTLTSKNQSSEKASSIMKDKSTSFLSSFSVNNDLMEEMDKMEAAVVENISTHKGGPFKTCKKNTTTTVVDKSDLHFKESGRKSIICTNKDLVKRRRSQNPGRVVNTEQRSQHLGDLRKVDSPSNSPLDKKQRVHSRNHIARSIQNKYVYKLGSLHESSAHSNCLVADSGDRSSSNMDACPDISFSPLITTPDISPNSSDNESSSPSKQGHSCHKQNSKHLAKRKMTGITETPKRAVCRKRPSPKCTKSPVVKTIKTKTNVCAAQECRTTRSPSKSTKYPQNGQDLLLSPSQLQSTVKDRKAKEDVNLTKTFVTKANLPRKEENCVTRNGKSAQGYDIGNKTQSFDHSLSKSESGNPTNNSADAIMTSECNAKVGSGKRSDSKTHSTLNTDANPPEQMSVIEGDASLTEDKRKLDSWGLPRPVLEAYQAQGVSTMFEWQAECLLSPGVLEGGNLVYSAPTSAGKTLVAELLVLKRVLETRKKALIILPFVSVAREKMFSLKRLYQDAGIKVGGYMGSYNPAGGLAALDVAVCTIEKGNGLVNRMMEDGRIDDIGIVVVDELHMIGDSHRGYLLELMLTKLSYMAVRNKSQQPLQIIGMSATLPNLEVLAKWLNAALYRTEFRPVPLSEHIKVDTKILDCHLRIQGQIPAYLISSDDADNVIALCLETVVGGHSVLLFCPTKNWCEKLCETIARKFYEMTHSVKGEKDDSTSLLTLNKDSLRESIEQLRRCPVGVDPLLGKCLLNGVAYHHAGLTFDERDIVEGAFRQGSLKVLIATSTLSSGVNLPARRVIIRTPMFHGKVLDTLTYKQMSGRAGRKGADTEGESILMCKASEKMKGKQLLQSDLPPVESCLYFDEDSDLSRSLKRAILEVVVSGVASSPPEVLAYINCTLLSVSLESIKGDNQISSLMERCTKFLQDNEFVSMQSVVNEDGSEIKKFFPTQLGSAILASSMSPDEGIVVFSELQKARRSFVLETDLHIIYLVTPIYTSDISASIDWFHYYTLWEGLTPADRRVAELVGVTEAFIARAISGRINSKTDAHRKSLAVHQRFYTALVLNTLVQEVPLVEVAARFSLNKGQLQSLQQSAATYAGMITVFSGRLGWHNLELILSNFQRRLSLGVQHELVDLVRISTLNASSARMLYNAGFTNVADVAHAETIAVENLFKKAVPFQSEKKQDGETEWERRERCKARCIWLTGRKGMTEFDAAVAIIEEAKTIVQGDMGVKAVDWAAKGKDSYDNDDDSDDDVVDGSDKENVDSQTFETTRNSRKGEERNENVSFLNAKTTRSNRSQAFTQLKPRPSIGETSRQSSSYFRKNRLFSGNKSLCRSVGESKKNSLSSDAFKSCTGSPENEVSVIARRSQGSGRVLRRRSDKSISKEKSFFGQVVVSPPPGISPRNLSSHCVLNKSDLSTADSSDRHYVKCPEEKSKFLGQCSENGIHSEGMKTVNLKRGRRSREIVCDNSEGIMTEVLSEIDLQQETDFKQGLKQDGQQTNTVSRVVRSTFVKIVDHCQKPGRPEELLPASKLEEARNGGPNFSPIAKLDVSSNGNCNEEEGKGDPVYTSNSSATHDKLNRLVIDDDGNECDKSNASSFDCSFGGSFVLDTQTVDIINRGVQRDTTSNWSRPSQSSVNSFGCLDVRKMNLSEKEIEEESEGSEVDENDCVTPDIQGDKSEIKVKEKDLLSKSIDVSILDDEIEDLNLCHKVTEGVHRKKNAFSMSCHGRNTDERSLTEEHQEDESDLYSSLVDASNYGHAVNFDEGMLECSGLEDEDEGTNAYGNGLNRSCTESDAVKGDSSAQIDSTQTPESASQTSDTQRTDDSLLAAVGMLTCFYPLSPKVLVNDHNTDASSGSMVTAKQTPVTVSTEGKHRKDAKDQLSGKQMRTEAVMENSLQGFYNEEDLFSDTFTASLIDQAFAQCALNSNNTPLIQGKIETRKKLTPPDQGKTKLKQLSASVENMRTVRLLPDAIESPASNNSSCIESPNCVPPTPPNKNLSFVGSPALKQAVLTPLKKREKNSSVEMDNKNVSHKEQHKPTCCTLDLTGRPKQSASQGCKQDVRGLSCSNGKVLGERNTPKELRTFQAKKSANEFVRDGSESGEMNPVSDDPTLDPALRVRASQPLTQQSFTIVDVCAHRELFCTFLNEWKAQSNFALALACEKMQTVNKEKPAVSIGGRFMKKCSPLKCDYNPAGLVVPDIAVMIVGLAVSWENRDAYFISLTDLTFDEQDADDSLAEPPMCEDLSLSERIAAVREVLTSYSGNHLSHQGISLYDAKTAYIYMAKTLGISLSPCQDPRIADWLKEQGSRLKNLHRMVVNFLPEEIPLLEAVGGVSGYQGLGTDVRSKVSGRIRSCTESVLTLKLMREYQEQLEKEELWDAFVHTEMPSLITLARMEMNGFGIDPHELEAQKVLMTTKLDRLEQEAYRLAGHPFSLTSTDDIARILYVNLKLPINGDPDCVRKLPPRSSRRKSAAIGGTGKEILEKLQKFHALPTLILEWRRISSALTKSLFALQKAATPCDRLGMMRVFGECQIFSATGRVGMAEPNIQNIPKDFAIQLSDLKHGGVGGSNLGERSSAMLSTPVSMRRLFVPFQGGMIVGADYSQLELRIIAHLAEDKRLIQILNSDNGDVFKLIAAQMKVIDLCEVTPSDRQQAKQVCYGMLYGIGAKALGDQLGMCDEDASVFMEKFKSKYPGVRRYLRETVEFCQKNGFVKTLFNRRRYLPAIKHSNPNVRAHAERQAVNTSIQGSAADLVKRAMNSIDERLAQLFPDSKIAHSQARLNCVSSTNDTKKAKQGTAAVLPRGAFFVLQLHDELIYEVSAEHVSTVARLVKHEMEKAVKLNVKMPVKVKVGPSWGHLDDYET